MSFKEDFKFSGFEVFLIIIIGIFIGVVLNILLLNLHNYKDNGVSNIVYKENATLTWVIRGNIVEKDGKEWFYDVQNDKFFEVGNEENNWIVDNKDNAYFVNRFCSNIVTSITRRCDFIIDRSCQNVIYTSIVQYCPVNFSEKNITTRFGDD